MQRIGIGYVIFPLALLGLIGGMVVLALDFSQEARRLPIVIGTPVVAMLAIQIVRDFRRRQRGETETEDQASGIVNAPTFEEDGDDGRGEVLGGREASEEAAKPGGAGPDWQGGASPVVALLWIVIFAVCVFVLGVMITAFVFPPLFMLTQGRERWLPTLIVTLISAGMTYFGFVMLLGVRIYPGWLFS